MCSAPSRVRMTDGFPIFYAATEKHYLMAGVWYEVRSTLTVRGAEPFLAPAARSFYKQKNRKCAGFIDDAAERARQTAAGSTYRTPIRSGLRRAGN